MPLSFVPPDAIPKHWAAMEAVLRPAIEQSTLDAETVLARLSSGEFAAFAVSGEGRGWIIAARGNGNFYVVLAAGQVAQGLASMRSVLRELETIARSAGCQRLHIEGRPGWARVLASPNTSIVRNSRDEPIISKVI